MHPELAIETVSVDREGVCIVRNAKHTESVHNIAAEKAGSTKDGCGMT